jgi:hypothetical protein
MMLLLLLVVMVMAAVTDDAADSAADSAVPRQSSSRTTTSEFRLWTFARSPTITDSDEWAPRAPVHPRRSFYSSSRSSRRTTPVLLDTATPPPSSYASFAFSSSPSFLGDNDARTQQQQQRSKGSEAHQNVPRSTHRSALTFTVPHCSAVGFRLSPRQRRSRRYSRLRLPPPTTLPSTPAPVCAGAAQLPTLRRRPLAPPRRLYTAATERQRPVTYATHLRQPPPPHGPRVRWAERPCSTGARRGPQRFFAPFGATDARPSAPHSPLSAPYLLP